MRRPGRNPTREWLRNAVRAEKKNHSRAKAGTDAMKRQRAGALELHFRPLGPDDQDLLLEYLVLAVFIPPGQPPLPAEALLDPSLSRYVDGWGRPHDDGILASDGVLDVGAAWLRLWETGERGFGFVDERTPELSVAVRPPYRGRGIGTALIRRLLVGADARFPAVSLSVSEANPAIRLYLRLGFRPVTSNNGALTMMRRRPDDRAEAETNQRKIP
jgi:GNAT superfamily N-acetyltransferase